MTLTETCELPSVKASAFLWGYSNKHNWHSHQSWGTTDSLVINLFTHIRSFQSMQKEHPLLMQNVFSNLQRATNWRKFSKDLVGPNVVEVATYLEHLKQLPDVDVSFECPVLVTEICWLVENIIQRKLTRLDAILEELSSVSLGIGRNVIMLANLVAHKIIRRDQAGKVLDLCLSPIYMTLLLDELLFRNEFSEILDEAAIDDSILKIIDAVLQEESKAVEQIKAGKDKAIGSIIGKVVKQVKIDPRTLKELVLKRISDIGPK